MRVHISYPDRSLERPNVAESKARQDFVDTLDVDILKPLTALKVSQGLLIRIAVSNLTGLFNRNRWRRRKSDSRKN